MRSHGSNRTLGCVGVKTLATTFGLGLLAGLVPYTEARTLSAQDAAQAPDFTPATVSTRVLPKYPPEAQRAGAQGIVLLDVEVDDQGRVTDIRQLYGKSEFREAATKAVRQWQFRPAVRAGTRTADTVPVTIPFFLADLPGSRFSDLARALQESNERVRLRVVQYAGVPKPPLRRAECLALLRLAQRDESAAVRGLATSYAAPLEGGAGYAGLAGNWTWTGQRTPSTVNGRLVRDGHADDLSGAGRLVVAMDGSFVVLTDPAELSFMGQIASDGAVEATPGGMEVVTCVQASGGVVSHRYTFQLRGRLTGDQATGFRLAFEGESPPTCPGAPVFKLTYELTKNPR